MKRSLWLFPKGQRSCKGTAFNEQEISTARAQHLRLRQALELLYLNSTTPHHPHARDEELGLSLAAQQQPFGPRSPPWWLGVGCIIAAASGSSVTLSDTALLSWLSWTQWDSCMWGLLLWPSGKRKGELLRAVVMRCWETSPAKVSPIFCWWYRVGSSRV